MRQCALFVIAQHGMGWDTLLVLVLPPLKSLLKGPPAASSSEEKLHAQLPHLKVDRGQYYEVRIIEDLPLKDCVTKVTKLVDNGSDIVDVEG